jgi:membrane protein YqaA with SNARE-associated domain
MLKQAYAACAGWSHKPQGSHLLFWYALTESCIVPLPADPLLITLCAGAPQRSLRFGLICGLGSVLGGLLGYGIGHYAFDSFGQTILHFYDPDLHTFTHIEGIYEQWGFWGVLMAAITPIPYKVFTLASGVFDFNLGQFVLASVIGRNVRFVGIAALMAVGGNRMHQWHENAGVAFWGLGLGLAVFSFWGLTLL